MTDLIEVKTSNLVDEQLAWGMDKAEGLDVKLEPPRYNGIGWRVFARYTAEVTVRDTRYNPHESWALGGLSSKSPIELSEVLIRCLDEISFCASFARRRP